MSNEHLVEEIVAAGFLVVAACVFISRSLAERDLTRNLDRVLRGEKSAGEALSLRGRLIAAVRHLGSYAQRLSIFSPKDIAELERAARSAGYSPETAVPVVIGGKLILLLACPIIAFVLTRNFASPTPMISAAGGIVVGMFGPNAAISYARRQRTRALRVGLSDSLDLLVVCAEAGLGLESAIDRVAAEMRHSNQQVAQEFLTLAQDLRLSSDRGAALMRMGERTGLDNFQRLTMTLAQTLRYGTPLGQALRLLAIEMRTDRMLRLEEKAAKLPTLMMLPLAAFILPCLFIVVAGPAALRIISLMH
jgi:tight adherence protein C